MKRFVLSIVVSFVLSVPALAQFGISHVSIETEEGPMFNMGTACLIDHDLVITCWHAIDGEDWRVRFGRKHYSGTVVAVDTQMDLALVRLNQKVEGQKILPVSTATAGETVWVGGFGGDVGNFKYQKGYLHSRFVNHLGGYSTHIADVLPRQGDSGGPLLNSKGHLVGIVWAYAGEPVLDEDGNRTTELVPGTEFGIAAEFLPFLVTSLPDHKSWQYYSKVDTYEPVRREHQWQIRERQLEFFIQMHELPVPARVPYWVD